MSIVYATLESLSSPTSRVTNVCPPLAARRMNAQSKVESRTTSAGRDLAVSIGSEPNPGAGLLVGCRLLVSGCRHRTRPRILRAWDEPPRCVQEMMPRRGWTLLFEGENRERDTNRAQPLVFFPRNCDLSSALHPRSPIPGARRRQK
jgi:hypothetical protein